jgi:hypothetical protein
VTYQLTSHPGTIYCTTTQQWIPRDPANRDYAEFLAWEAAGNTPDPAPAPPAIDDPTPLDRLIAAGLTVEELRALLA